MTYRQGIEDAAQLVESCTDIVSEATARKLASRIRALNEPNVSRTLALSLIETADLAQVQQELAGE